mmetsp:Transcript_22736/g.29028  ORF Transcript_22736/g.29028 Transcript_22736/m.29028 type:complete len:110 (+) Transcript_22736:386-715(+)
MEFCLLLMLPIQILLVVVFRTIRFLAATSNTVPPEMMLKITGMDQCIPWSLLAQYPGAGPQIPPASTFRVNFRVDTPKNQAKEYSAWSCDNSSPACFHEPLYFGYLNIN